LHRNLPRPLKDEQYFDPESGLAYCRISILPQVQSDAARITYARPVITGIAVFLILLIGIKTSGQFWGAVIALIAMFVGILWNFRELNLSKRHSEWVGATFIACSCCQLILIEMVTLIFAQLLMYDSFPYLPAMVGNSPTASQLKAGNDMVVSMFGSLLIGMLSPTLLITGVLQSFSGLSTRLETFWISGILSIIATYIADQALGIPNGLGNYHQALFAMRLPESHNFYRDVSLGLAVQAFLIVVTGTAIALFGWLAAKLSSLRLVRG